MERRKISSLGKYSLIVTLPKKWTNMNRLQSGDEVSIDIQGDGALVIHPELEYTAKEDEVILPINVDEDVKMIQRKIVGSYLNGYDTIVLTSGKNFLSEQQDGIRSIVKSLYLRIYESHANHITLKAFMDESLASIDSGVERMHIITYSMARDVINALRDWDIELAKSVLSLEEDVDQFMFFLTRLIRTAVNNPALASKLQVSMSDCFDYHLLINRVEYVADGLTSISESIISLYDYRASITEDIIQSLTEEATKAIGYYELAVDTFFEDSIDGLGTIIDFADENKVLDDILEKISVNGKMDSHAVILFHSILENIQRISNYAADIAEIVIDRHYSPE